MKTKLRAAVGSLLVTAVAVGAVVVPASSQAAQVGQVCHVDSLRAPAPVQHKESSVVLYWLGAGAGFRITAYWGSYYLGNGNGMAEGIIWRNDLNQASCHW